MSYREQAAAVLAVYKRSPRFRKELNWSRFVEDKILDYMESTQLVPNIINVEKAVERMDAKGFFEEEAQMAQQTQQTQQERTQILADYFRDRFATDFPELEQIYDDNGDVICGPSHIVLAGIFPNMIPMTTNRLVAKLAELAGLGLLVRKSRDRVVVVEKIIEPTPEEKAATEKKERRAKFEAAHAKGFHTDSRFNRNELDDKFNHGKERPAPLTEPQRQALNAKAERENAIIADVQSRISNFTDKTHAKTYKAREALKKVFIDAMNKKLGAEAVQKAVESEIDRLAGNNSIR